ncbi:type II secretion system protein [Cyanobium sp. Cruz-8H5]|uniref:type II secretion system protein n=1 Tax=Cyanobium sp. Cruz-8H5 TaxID=2823712 RepID=UPI0037BE25DA|nr:type II secretion system protein [Cyanobium sp. Cruz-8H5]
MKHDIHRTSGFTLAEVLVVIGITGVLVGILLPALGRTWDRAREVACQSNLRQLHLISVQYRQDHRGKSWVEDRSEGNAWTDHVQQAGSSKVLLCPAASEAVPAGLALTQSTSGDLGSSLPAGHGTDDYAWDDRVAVWSPGLVGSYGWNREAGLVVSGASQDNLVLFGDCALPTGSYNDPSGWMEISDGLGISGLAGRLVPSGGFGLSRHRGGFQVVHVGGHVERIPLPSGR